VRRIACRAASLVCLALTAAPISALLTSHPAAASAPTASVYWVKAGAPVLTAPPGGLVVANDPTVAAAAPPSGLPVSGLPTPPPGTVGPAAISAVRIAGVDPTSAATLSLAVANGSSPPPPSVTHIVACPIVGHWQPPPGGVGDTANAPARNCSSPSPGKVAADNTSVSWLLPASFQSKPGQFDVALVPDPAGPAVPFAVTFDPPGLNSVQGPSGPPPPPPPPAPSSAPSAAPSAAPPAAPVAATPVTPDLSAPITPAPPVASASAPQTIQLQTAPSSTAQNAGLAGVHLPGLSDDRAHRIMAVALLLGMGAALWWVGGQPAREPRLLGALAGASVEPEAARGMGGVGRFRRPRATSVRRL
jgi:hypothetical protein